MSLYIQIGGGVGDQDYSAGLKDGFKSYIRNQALAPDDQVKVIEANPLIIDRLKESWSDCPQAQVLHIAITAEEFPSSSEIEFFYSPNDAPFYQISSTIKSHVEKYYPDSHISSFSVPVLNINDFLSQFHDFLSIELLATDIEGLDTAVIGAIDLDRFSIHQLSFEKTHAKHQYQDLIRKLKKYGYKRAGMGMDPHNSDVLWILPNTKLESLKCFFSNFFHFLWEIQIPFRHKLKKLPFLRN
jgi:FkbM family methyltransferase